ncbi:MAG: hypothetical protein M3Z25_03950 [Actinomycetota bacterium]|nr:hypothetical protein [Pseudonocardiales bacterium]MDQ2706819.1 hypothetical protein [Actinomycetota bacterium]
MSDMEQTTYHADHDTASGRQTESGASTTAAERLGGPSATDEGGAQATGTAAASNGHANAALIAPDRAESYRGRWNALKGEFVDEPRSAVRGANELVGEVLDELEELFRRQRDEIEHGLASDETSTEDLRQALGNYGSFFDRLLSF